MMSPKELEKETTKPAQDQCDTDAIIQGHDCHESKLDEMDIRVKPWKYIGYKGYSDFISSDDDFFILRRFDSLNTRIALLLQDQVSSLEEQLSKLDNSLSCRECEDTNNGTFRDDIEERATLLDAIVGKLRQYNDMLLQQSSLRKLQRAPERDIQNVKNWHFNFDYAAIVAEEQDYLRHSDLVSVAQRAKSPLRHLIDCSNRLRTLPLWKHREGDIPDYNIAQVSYYSDKRIDGFASGIIIFIGITMLVTPIWILQSMENLQIKLIVITIFILTFLLLLSLAMSAKPFEALGATAAYAALLMVFVQVGAGSPD